MTTRTRASWLVYALGALSVGAIVAAVLVVGPAPASQSSITRTATVARGVVQSTVSGTGNLAPASQLDLGFKTSGTITHIYVSQGQHVTDGQLIASLDPQSAEVTLEQAKATLQSSEANLAREEETDGESSSSTGSGASGSGGTASAATASAASATPVAFASAAPPGTPTTTTPSTTTPTAPVSSTPTTTTTPSTTTTTTPTSTTPASTTTPSTRKSSSGSSSTGGDTTTTSSSSSKLSTATREANLASAKADVKSDRLTVQSDEQAVQDTNLYAPENGTLASLSGQVGEVISASGTSRVSSSSDSSSSSSASTGAGASTGRGTTAASSSTGSTGSSSSSSFAVLTDLSSMQLVVPLSESEIGNVHEGQIATVTVEALEGRKLAAHVSEVSILSTSNSGVVSYDVTFELDQTETGLKPGMSATAEVVVKQAEGVNVPTTAITADSVTVVQGGKQVRRRVVTGLAGNSSTIVLSGLKAGETVLLPSTSTSTSKTSSLRSGLRSALGGAGGAGAGGGGFGGGGGGAAFFRGGG